MPSTSKLLLFSLVQAILARSSLADACPTDTTITVTVAQPASTATVTTGTASTSYVFLPGNPAPTQPPGRKKRSPCKPNNSSSSSSTTASVSAGSTSTATAPSTTSSASADSTTTAITLLSTTADATTASASPTTTSPITTTSACPQVNTVTLTATADSASTITTTVAAPATTTTVYPCATPLVNFRGPAYGDASGASALGLTNQIFYSNQPQGASAEACCNACHFDVPNCIQAYWYSYQGCVVSTATVLSAASGQGISNSCPAGTFNGLSYGPDTAPAFRSTGNIAGPCGQAYSNLS